MSGRYQRYRPSPEGVLAGSVPSAIIDPALVERYSAALVHVCLGVEGGDTLFVDCEPAHRELAVALAESAYRAGARHVDVVYRDARIQRAKLALVSEEELGATSPWEQRRLRAAVDPRAALIQIDGDEDPTILEDLDPGRVAQAFGRRARNRAWFLEALTKGKLRWCVAAWPTAGWAAKVYPELSPADGVVRLGHDLVRFGRLAPEDGTGFDGWARHTERLEERASALSRLGLERLELRGPGTELDVVLAPDTRFLGGGEETTHGARIFPNFPTEEVFTTPEARGTEGTFRCTRPLSFQGRVIEGIAGEFRRGRLQTITAAREDDRDLLAGALDCDRGARRLGEVALVDRHSRVGQAGRIYGMTLLDENAASHIAFGDGFIGARRSEPGARRPPGVNRSAMHLDVMIGSDELEVTGIARGRRVPLLRGGEWQPLEG